MIQLVRADPTVASVRWEPAEQVSFERGRTDLSTRCREKIERLAAWVKGHPGVALALGVRADAAVTGEPDARIGPARARVVREALITAGVAPLRIVPAVYTIREPSCTQTTAACYEKNRRVEVFFGGRY